MFELHITCSKDFDSLNIQFSDGSVGTFSGVEKTPKSDRTEKVKKMENVSKHEKSEQTNRSEKVIKPERVPENFLDHFEKPKNTNSSNLPEIPDITEVKVDPDLNDLEI